MDREVLFKEIRNIVADVVEVDEEEIESDTSFVDDLEVDSMIGLEILVAIEKKYKVKIPEERLSDITSLNDTVALVKEFIDG